METEYFMRYFSSATCYDRNIIRRAAVPFQPTRKAFSTNAECISVCWNSQKMKNGCSKRHHGYQLEKKHHPRSSSIFWSVMEPSEGSQGPAKGSQQERRDKLPHSAGPAPVTSPQITSGHCTKIPSDSAGRGCGDKGSFWGWH